MSRWLILFAALAAGCGGDTGAGGGGGNSDGGGTPGPTGNGAPAFASTPPATIPEGQTYLYAAAAEDPDAEPVRYTKIEGPDGLEVSRDTGAVFWVVGQRAAGTHRFVIEAADPHGAAVRQRAEVIVTRVNTAPRLLGHPPTRGAVGMPWSFPAAAADDDGDALTFRIRDASADVRVDEKTGLVTFTPGAPGVVRATLEVADPDGLTAAEEFTVGVPTGNDATPPPASLAGPPNGAVIDKVINVNGSVSAPDLAGWTLEVCQPPSAMSCREIGRGTRPVQNGTLGRLDPSPLLDEPARVRLTGWDADHNRTVVERDVEVKSTLHLGLFGLEMTDLVTRVDRVRVELGRAYDSRSLRDDGDFGRGWTLSSSLARAAEMMPGSIQLAAPKELARGYNRVPCGFNCPDRIEPPQIITLTVGRTVWVFNFQPTQQAWVDRLSVKAKYTAPPGASIRPIQENGNLYYDGWLSAETEAGSVALRCWEAGDMLYEPPAFHFEVPGKNGPFTVDVARSGRVLRMTGTPDLGGPMQPAGPTLTRDGVVGTRGLMVKFERDGGGRIVRMQDVVYGGEVKYRYDGDGQLVAVEYAGGKSAAFEYAAGRLTRYTLPDGIGVTRVEYDRDGRAVRKVLPDGRILVFDYDDVARKITLRDARGAAFVYGYDERGNVETMVDPMGHRVEMTHDAAGRLLRLVDAGGRTSQFDYDGNGNLTRQTLPGQGTLRATWNADGLPQQVTDPLGRRFTLEMDGQGRPATVRGPDGAAVYRVTYDASEQIATITEGPGRISRFRYDAEGRETRTEEVGGHTIDVAWSQDGLRAEATDEDGERSVAVTTPEGELIEASNAAATIKYDYDFAGELAGTDSPAGRLRFARNAGGDLTGIESDGKAVTARQYDAAGRLSLIKNADGSFERYRYDEADRVIARTTPQGTRTYAWDAAGQLVEEMDEDGDATAYKRDAEGRAVELQDATGDRVQMTWDAQGRIASRTDASGAVTRFTYDPVSGLPSKIEGPCGTEERAYDTRFLLPDRVEANDVPLLSKRDASGVLLRYRNDDQGRLVEVLDPAGGLTRYTYDVDLAVSEVQDAAGARWKFVYDGPDLVSVTTPEGRIVEHTPDGSTVRGDGSVVRPSAGGAGEAIMTYAGTLALSVTRDESGRPLRTSSPPDNVEYGYDEKGRLTAVKHGDGAAARFEHDARGRLAAVEARAPDGATARMSYEYDRHDRVAAFVDPAGGRTGYEYDAAGRIAKIRRANNSESHYQYTASGQPAEVTHTLAGGQVLRYAWDYDAACRRTREVTPEGTFTYAYDALGRIERVEGPEGVTRYAWDPVGNRARVEGPGGTTTYTFDRDGRVKSAASPRGATTFTHDDRGNLTTIAGPDGTTRYEYDEADRLAAVVTPKGERFTQRYDAEGHLVDLGAPGDGQAGARRCLAAPRAGLSAFSGCLAFYGGGGPLRLTLHGPEGIAGDGGKDGARFAHLGALGSVAALSDSRGALLGASTYDAFGTARTDTLPADFAFRFAGEIARGGLVFLRSRWYAPALGAFTSADAADADFQDPRSLHRYAYAFGDPLNRLDPNGTIPTVSAMLATTSIQSNMRAQNQAATQRARCIATKKLVKLIGQWAIKLMLSTMLRSLTAALTPQLALLGEIDADKILRNLLFCRSNGSSSRPWLGDAGFGGVRFQVDINRCGTEPQGGLFETCGGAAKPGVVPGGNSSGMDFLLDSSGPEKYGLPIELKGGPDFPEGSGIPNQFYRYCRYGSRGPYKMMIYTFYKQLPSDLVFTRRALGCMTCWAKRNGEIGSCGPHPKIGAVLIALGKDKKGRFRIKYPDPPSLCGIL